ncbi:MAG TPA: HD domain-containing phosphohydrolase [Bacillota bacterium]|nr:HD domain-containing phosphohydrolase [Bacillota bacterium]HQE65197.1 HD domain-containing phosphohydrolase [Bacillota bacterium]HQI16989.1 HD domain-containing phosphohydrolase [Bacillota bacterium]HQJ36469.1 HD domain-containing phosphohydrolase [Bacillota bacterium]HRS20711.1 HD domain-containing phosphohydrolase [Clostridia bacterium]
MSTANAKLGDHLEELLNIGIALSAEKNHTKLLERILQEARRITNADAGTLYLCEQDHLVFKIIHNDTLGIYQGGHGEPVDLPPVPLDPANVSSWVALNKKSVNIPDVYNADNFDFSGPKKYDAITGYRTGSMLVVPLENNDGEVIGVLQLLNAKNEKGQTIPFAPDLERIVFSLASQAAVSLTNMQYIQEIDNLFHSFVQVMATAIDARTPYNVNHTRNIARLAEKFAAYLDNLTGGPFSSEKFPESRTAQLVMAAWLHDIGKVAIPLSVMDKPSRLGERIEYVRQRLELVENRLIRSFLEKKVAGAEEHDQEEEHRQQLERLSQARELIEKANNPSTFVDQDLARELSELANWEPLPGVRLLTDEELTCLSIPKGTLTNEERKIMESHVTVAKRMLEKIRFNSRYKDVPAWALSHHELLDGTGYPQGLKAGEITLEARILAVLDVYDALTASDRPYKKAMPPNTAISILEKMAEEGKLDNLLVAAFKESRIWEE